MSTYFRLRTISVRARPVQIVIVLLALAIVLSACDDPVTSVPSPQLEERSLTTSAQENQKPGSLTLRTFSGAGEAGRAALRQSFREMEAGMPGGTSRTVISTQIDGERRVFTGERWSDLLTNDLKIRPELLEGSDMERRENSTPR